MSTKAGRPYSRCYYVDLERDYPAVYHDDHLYATYMRLLNAAEASWPAVPEVPRSARLVYVERLVVATLVQRCEGFGFRIKGLDRERTARSDAGRIGAQGRWGNADGNAVRNADRIAERNAIAMPNQAEPNQTEIPPPPTGGGHRSDKTNLRANGHAPRDEGTNPRTQGTSPRQEREAQKRGGKSELLRLNAFLRASNARRHSGERLMAHYQSCALCGVEGPSVVIRLVRWKEPEPTEYSSIPRCADYAACQGRVRQQGEEWPLAEREGARP